MIEYRGGALLLRTFSVSMQKTSSNKVRFPQKVMSTLRSMTMPRGCFLDDGNDKLSGVDF